MEDFLFLIPLLMFSIPLFIVMALCTTCFIAGFKYKKELEGRRGWAMVLSLMGILVCYLSYRSLDEAGFVTPIIMGLILAGFFWFMAMLPVMPKGKNGQE